MVKASFDLYKLLPEYIRRTDVEQGTPLEALLNSAQKQADLVYSDIRHLWDNFFVETCDDWVLPYIADLIALNLIDDDPANNRREVARTIAYRRRKGTVPQLETMARDVTGFDAHVVEFFERMLWNQSMIHFRFDDPWTIDLRDKSTLARIGTAFDRASHTADLRPSTQKQGWYNIRKLGFFLWRLLAIPLNGVEAHAAPSPAPAGAYHFNVLGHPEPLFQSPPPLERGADAAWPRSTELDVVSPVPPWLFKESPDRYWHTAMGFTIYVNGTPASQTAVPSDLCAWTAPSTGQIAVDVRLGRFLFNPAEAPGANDVLTVDFHFGFSGDIGGGGYDRQASLRPLAGETADVVHVSKAGPVTSISAALTQLVASTADLRVLQIDDSRNYSETLTLPATFKTLVIQAADGQRPTIVLSDAATAFKGPTSGDRLVLSGLQITGEGQTLTLPAGVQQFVVEDCTVDPGGGRGPDGVTALPGGVTIQVTAPALGVCLNIIRSIVGPLDLPQGMDCVALSDSIADAQAFPSAAIMTSGPPATVLRCTLLGTFGCYRLEASESIFQGTATALRRQEGCVRFCYFAPGSLVPRRFECAPANPPPVFTAQSFGDPGYTQLALNCTDGIAKGGDNGREMGVWASRRNPRRMEHLQLRLAEYLPAGLVPLFIFVT